MISALNRRACLRLLAGTTGITVAGRAVLHTAFAESSDTAPLAVINLTEKHLLITGAGTNVLAVIGADSVLLVDGGSSARSAELLKLVAEKSGGKPIEFLFDTSWDPDCTGSNEAAGKSGATIIAHENTKLWLGTEFHSRWRKVTYEPHPRAALPTKTFYEGVQKMTFGSEPVEYGYMMQAHTDGDIYVFFPKANVLVIGDVIAQKSWPFIDWWTGGWIFGVVSGLDTVLKVANDQTRIVAGQGGVMTRADLEAQRKMFGNIAQRLRALMFGGRNVDDALAAQPTKEYNDRMGDPKDFIRLAFDSMWGHFTPDA